MFIGFLVFHMVIFCMLDEVFIVGVSKLCSVRECVTLSGFLNLGVLNCMK